MINSTLEIPNAEFDRVASGLFAYLFNLINRQAYYEYVGDRVLAGSVLAKARGSGYILKNCKLYAHAFFAARSTGEAVSYKGFGVSRKDALFLQRLNTKTCRFPTLSIQQFDKLIAQSLMTPDMQAHIGKLISRKMIFLVRSYGVKRDDLESALISASLYALYKQYPRYESALHAKNICKTTIHNTAMNLIQHHTRGKRQALLAVEDGMFEAVHVPMTAVFDLEAPVEHPHREVIQSLVSLQHKMAPKVQEFLTAAAGLYHEGLSDYLGMANDDAVESMKYDAYLGKLRLYFDVSEQQTQKLFERLRPHLA